MATRHVSELFIYRWRYTLGYIAVAIACITVLVVASLYIPGGLSEREVNSVAATNALSLKQFSPDMVVDLPYYLMQKASFFFLGLSELSVKLPTIILGFFSAVGVMLLLRMWFKQNVAILTALICITTGPFLLAAQSGTPGIMYIFWPVWLLYFASRISRRAQFPLLNKTLFFVTLALSLYTPLSLYVIVALVSAALLHPHLRHMLRQLSKARIAITVTIAAAFTAPLVYALVRDPSVTLELLGIPTDLNIQANLQLLFQQYFSFFKPVNGTIMTPVYEIASLLLMGLGLYRILTAKYTARSYVLSAWLVLLLPIFIVSPQLVNVTFVPFVLLTGYGIDFLIRYWYRLFPRNPYARVVGLLPIMILITTLVLSGVDRFVYGYLYNPAQSRLSSKDLSLLSTELSRPQTGVITLIVAESEKPFYDAARRYNPDWKVQHVVTNFAQAAVPGTVISSHDALEKTNPVPTKVIASSLSSDADRFYIYKSSTK